MNEEDNFEWRQLVGRFSLSIRHIPRFYAEAQLLQILLQKNAGEM